MSPRTSFYTPEDAGKCLTPPLGLTWQRKESREDVHPVCDHFCQDAVVGGIQKADAREGVVELPQRAYAAHWGGGE